MGTLDQTVCIGIDIAKAKFDAGFSPEHGKTKTAEFENTPLGFEMLLRWADLVSSGAKFSFYMEATGSYHVALAKYLTNAGYEVSVINPNRTHHSAKSEGAANKTDPADAGVISRYGRKENPPKWRQSRPEVETVNSLLRRYKSLKRIIVQEKNRLKDPSIDGQKETRESVDRVIEFLATEAERVWEQMTARIKADAELKKANGLLMSIPGFGPVTTAAILAELPHILAAESAKSAAAFAGLAPSQYSSGKTVHRKTRLSKQGNPHLRQALYMSALSAIKANQAVRAIYQRKLDEGRPKMVALGAAMRKLMMIAYGVLTSGKEFHNAAAHP